VPKLCLYIASLLSIEGQLIRRASFGSGVLQASMQALAGFDTFGAFQGLFGLSAGFRRFTQIYAGFMQASRICRPAARYLQACPALWFYADLRRLMQALCRP